MARNRNSPKESRPKTVSFRLPDELMEHLRRLAKQNRRTLSGEVQLALEQHLENNGIAGDAKEKKTTLPH